MQYASLITEISNEDFDSLYNASEHDVASGNGGVDCYQDASGTWRLSEDLTLKEAMRIQIDTSFSDDSKTTFALYETGSDKMIHLQQGVLDNGTLTPVITLFGPDSSGSLAWAFAPPPDSVIETLMEPTGVRRIIMHPSGSNMENFIVTMGGVRINDIDGKKSYRTSWGWSTHPTPANYVAGD